VVIAVSYFRSSGSGVMGIYLIENVESRSPGSANFVNLGDGQWIFSAGTVLGLVKVDLVLLYDSLEEQVLLYFPLFPRRKR
jgi:hypothetical protein